MDNSDLRVWLLHSGSFVAWTTIKKGNIVSYTTRYLFNGIFAFGVKVLCLVAHSLTQPGPGLLLIPQYVAVHLGGCD